MKYHILAFGAGFLLDQLFGDPYFLPHPIRGIGWLIAKTEKTLRAGNPQGNPTEREGAERRQGKLLVVIVLLFTGMLSALILFGAYAMHPGLGVVIEAVMTYQILAARCLQVESSKVWKQLNAGSLEEARKAVSMIVGRDTEHLTEEGVAKAAIETVAENTSDGVIAPMLYTALGGPVLGFLYKAVNTMDSMVGYKNDRYLYFGRTAAKLDDIVEKSLRDAAIWEEVKDRLKKSALGMSGGHPPIVPCIHRLQHIQCLRSTTLSHNHPVWSHAKCRFDQVADRDRQNPFCIGIPCFQPHQIGFVDQLQFCRILNCDNSFLPWDKL